MNPLSAVLNSAFICPIWSHKYAHAYTHAHTHTILVKGVPLVLFLRGSRVVITDLHTLYLIAHTHLRRNTHAVTQACTHMHTFPVSSHQLWCVTSTTHRLTGWCCKARKSQHHTHTHTRQPIIITSNLQSSLGLAEISWGIFGCLT